MKRYLSVSEVAERTGLAVSNLIFAADVEPGQDIFLRSGTYRIDEVAVKDGRVYSVKAYSQIPGKLPEPDAMIGRVKGWLPKTIDNWIGHRG